MSKILIIIIILLLIITFYCYKPLFIVTLVGSGLLLFGQKFIGGNIDQNNYNPVEITGKFDYLAGPVSLCILTGEKNIILCGDMHNYQNIICDKEVYLPDYLDWLFKENSGENFDVFTETNYRYDKKVAIYTKSNSGLFTNFDQKFGKCFKNLLKKDWCADNYPNVRFHVSDYRHHHETQDDKIQTELSKYIDFRNYLNKHMDIIIDIFEKDKSVEKLFYNLFELSKINIYDTVILLDDMTKFIKHFVQDLLSDPKLKRNFEATGDMQPAIVNYIENHIKDGMQNKMENLTYLINMLKTKKDEKDNISLFRKAMYDFERLMTSLGVLIMDFYLLCRMFKKFDVAKESYITDPETKNVIIMAGDTHIQSYKKFLTSIGYKIEFEAIPNEKKCLDVKQMPDMIGEITLRLVN